MKLPAIEKCARALWAFAALALAAFSANASILAAERQGEAGMLAGAHPTDGLLQLQAAQQAISKDPNHTIDQKSLDAIRSTLRFLPLNPHALALLEIKSVAPNGTDQATDRAMTLVDRISRREPLSQLWMIEKASASEDVPSAVRHYDIVLSTNPNLATVLFPILTAALDFPEVRASLNGRLQSDRPWRAGFLSFAASNAKIDSYLGMIGSDYGMLRNPMMSQANSELTYRLASTGRGDEALLFASRTIENVDIGEFGKFDVSEVTADARLGKLAWSFGAGPKSVASLDESGVTILVEPGNNADALSRFFIVKPTPAFTYSITIEASSSPKPESIKVIASCASGPPASARGSWEKVVPVATGKSSSELRFAGLDACSLIQFRVRILGAEGQEPSVVRILKQSLSPL